MHKIDLKNYKIRTDMIVDLALGDKQIDTKSYEKDNVKISWMKLGSDNNYNKKQGNYLTLEFSDVSDSDERLKVSNVLKDEFKKMLDIVGFNKNFKTVIIGLGNIKSTPDSLGPLVSEKIIVTNHLYDMNIDVDKNLSRTSSFSPGVTGVTGIETSSYITGVIEELKPDLVIAVDALASSSISRVNKSIQITDSGISPGSGVGNKRKEVSKETIGIPVIAIGVPTVVDATIIVSDTINYMLENYAYNKSNNVKEKFEISDEDKATFLGLVGSLSKNDLINLTYEVLTPIGYNLMVTPKEIDFVMDNLSEVISYGINNSLHKL